MHRATATLKQALSNCSVGPIRESVRRFLQENDSKNVFLDLKPPLTEGNKLKRLSFAKKWLINGECTVALVAAEVMPRGLCLEDPEGTRGCSLED